MPTRSCEKSRHSGPAVACGGLLLATLLWSVPADAQQQLSPGFQPGAQAQPRPMSPRQPMSGPMQQQRMPEQSPWIGGMPPRGADRGVRSPDRSNVSRGDFGGPVRPPRQEWGADRFDDGPAVGRFDGPARRFPPDSPAESRRDIRPDQFDRRGREPFVDRGPDRQFREQFREPDNRRVFDRERDRPGEFRRDEDFADRRRDFRDDRLDRREDLFDQREDRRDFREDRRDIRGDRRDVLEDRSRRDFARDTQRRTRIESAADLGISVARAERNRFVVRNVQRSSIAARAGFREGDIILAVNNRPVTAINDFDVFLTQISFVQPVTFVVLRNGVEQVIYVEALGGGYDAAYASIRVGDNYFEPPVMHIAPGTTVRWTNYGRHSHTVTSVHGDWDSGELLPGETFTMTFHRPGRQDFFCRFHTRDRMEGSIIVGDPGAASYEVYRPSWNY